MPPAQEIPGFYYDGEKKKYFAIQPNHAGPSTSKYSFDGVKRQKFLEETEKLEATKREALKHLVGRALLLTEDPLNRLTLARENGLGTTRTFATDAAQALVNGWSTTEILQAKHGAPLQDFALDTATRVLYYSDDTYDLSAIEENSQRGTQLSVSKSRSRYSNTSGNSGVLSSHRDIATIDIEPTSRILLTTWQASGRPGVPLSSSSAAIQIGPLLDAPRPGIFGGSTDFIDTSQIFDLRSDRHGDDTEIFAATVAPPSSLFLFAICTNKGIKVIDKAINLGSPYASAKSHVLAVEFLENEPFILMSGQRNGRMRIIDVRSGLELPSPIICHPSSVRHIKQINAHTVVVAGLQSTLCNYDLRYCKLEPQYKSWPTHPTSSRNPERDQADSKYTLPVMLYPDYKNDAHLDFGFDVSREDGLVAAVVQKADYVTKGTDNGDDCVKVFSSESGELIRTLHSQEDGMSRNIAKSKALHFVADRDKGLPKSLWAAKAGKIIGYDW